MLTVWQELYKLTNNIHSHLQYLTIYLFVLLYLIHITSVIFTKDMLVIGKTVRQEKYNLTNNKHSRQHYLTNSNPSHINRDTA